MESTEEEVGPKQIIQLGWAGTVQHQLAAILGSQPSRKRQLPAAEPAQGEERKAAGWDPSLPCQPSSRQRAPSGGAAQRIPSRWDAAGRSHCRSGPLMEENLPEDCFRERTAKPVISSL